MEKKKPVSYEQFAEIEFLLREISVIVKRKGREILGPVSGDPSPVSALLLLREKRGFNHRGIEPKNVFGLQYDDRFD